MNTPPLMASCLLGAMMLLSTTAFFAVPASTTSRMESASANSSPLFLVMSSDISVEEHVPSKSDQGKKTSNSVSRASENRWAKAIAAFVEQDTASPPLSGGVLFTGSSTVRLWNLEDCFPGRVVLNRGFGGSQFSDLIEFADQIIGKHTPDYIVIYSGDNDIHARISPEEVAGNCIQTIARFQTLSPESRIIILAIKPSTARWTSYPKMQQANALMATHVKDMDNVVYIDLGPLLLDESGNPTPECFLEDQLHLSEEGYRRWSHALLKSL